MPEPPPVPVLDRDLRVAVTLEQLWHRVPGGTASAAIGSLWALLEHAGAPDEGTVDLVGVAARHGRPPPPPWTPPVEVRHLPLPRPLLYETWHRLRWPAVDRVTGAVDLIHVTGMAMPPKSAPMVVTVNDLVFLQNPELFTKRGVRFFHRSLELTARDGDVIVCPSRATIDDCVAYGLDERKLRLVHYGIDVDRATEDDVTTLRNRYNIAGPYVLWLGTIEPRKNVPALLRAFERVDADATLVLAGGTGWNEDLEPLAARLGGRVKRIGFVDEEVKAALFAGAAVFCLPSLLEGFGIPVLEAMAQGTPVITSRGTSTEELVSGEDGDVPADDVATEPDVAGVVIDPRDDQTIRDALQQLLDDEALRGRLGEAGRRRAARFTWEETARRLRAAYRDAVA